MSRILTVVGVLGGLALVPTGVGVADHTTSHVQQEGQVNEFFLEPDCQRIECDSADPGMECCLYWL